MTDLIVGQADKTVTSSDAPGSMRPSRERIAAIEYWPKWLFCVPLVAQWLWLSVRYGSVTLPSVLNPRIETGGLAGESKASYLEPIEGRLRAWIADVHAVRPGDDAIAVRTRAGLGYPLIAKPDIGWCGYGVCRLRSDAELGDYARAFPSDAVFLLQRYVPEAGEAGILYEREPGAERGRIAALTVRHLPHVIGDGESSVAALIARDARSRRKVELYRAALGDDVLARVPAPGERVDLTAVASVRVGGRYEDLTAHVTPALARIVDDIARAMGAFHYGRFDVKFATLADLQQGRFTIIEVNGAGSEAIQFWDPRVPLIETFAGIFEKQRALFALADRMRKLGARPVGWRALVRAYVRQQRLIARYPTSN